MVRATSLLVLGGLLFCACASAHRVEAPAPATRAAIFVPAPAPPELAPFGKAELTPPTPVTPDACPADMVLVEGDYCTEVRQLCAKMTQVPGMLMKTCTSFEPSVCTGTRVKKRFCIDRDEFVKSGEELPETHVNWYDAEKQCEASKKRLCHASEWELACEGPDMLAYPYGMSRDGSRCHHDELHVINPATGKLRDLRRKPSDFERCTSPFGVRNMVGNVDEWVHWDLKGGKYKSALKGGGWIPARNRCRPVTTEHFEKYESVQIGFRCCADATRPSP